MMALSVRQSARQQSSSSSSSRASTNTRYRRALQSSRRSRHGVRATTDARMATEQADRPGDANDDANNSQAAPKTPNLLGMARNTVKKASAPLSKVLDGNERLIARHRRTVKAINALEEEYASLSVEALLRKTSEFRARLSENEDTLDSLLPEAFAALRESVKRVLGLRLYDVQLIGGMVLHSGAVAEMKTGEGKTLVAQLAAYLNAIPRTGVHVVTVNDYLASRDADLARRVMAPLGITVGCVVSSLEPYSPERAAAYSCDVTYATNTELGFDLLRDNIARAPGEIMVRRPLSYSIVDEVDSVLVDEGRNPLILSNESDSNVYRFPVAIEVARNLWRDVHYRAEKKRRSVELTDTGMDEAARLLQEQGHDVGSDVWDGTNPWGPYIVCALSALENYERDAEYILRNDEVVIVDDFTGRIMPGRRWQDGLHQAVEAKEGVAVQNESSTIATVTYQMLFASYPKLSGMTGTAKTESSEMWTTYGLEVVTVPPNRPSQRVDYPLQLYMRAESKWRAVLKEVAFWHVYHKRPVLVGTTTVENSERISAMLAAYDIPHSLLNARPQFAAQEAAVVAQAGRVGAVTISTNMAGRGTDIVLGGNAVALATETFLQFLLSALSIDGGEGATLASDDGGDGDDDDGQIYDYSQLAMSASLTVAEIEDLNPSVVGLMQIAGLAARTECAERRVTRGAARRVVESLMDVVGDGSTADTREAFGRVAASVGLTESFGQPKLEAAAKELLNVARQICAREQEQVIFTGGLHIIGTELHESRRIDNQLRGRSGRQGDPGSTVFLCSLEDAIMQHSPPGALSTFIEGIGQGDEDTPLIGFAFTNYLETVQKSAENFYAYMRRTTLEVDEVQELHRSRINRLRARLLMCSPRLRRQAILLYLRRLGRDLVLTYADGNTPPKRWDVQGMLYTLQEETGGGMIPVLAGVTEETLRASIASGDACASAEVLGASWWSDGRENSESSASHVMRERSTVTCRPGDGPIRRYASAAALHAHILAATAPSTPVRTAAGSAAVAGVSSSLTPLSMSGVNHRDALARWLEMSGESAWRRVEGRWARDVERLSSVVGDALCKAYLDRLGVLVKDAVMGGLPTSVAWDELEFRERLLLLATLDENWQAYLRTESQLRSASYLQAVGQRDPQEVYRIECYRLFERTLDESCKGAATEALRLVAADRL